MKIGIVGLGLIGGTIAKALKSNHYISAFDVSGDALKYAVENQIIDKAYDNVSSFLHDNEVIYLCLYPNSIINFIFRNKHLFPKNSIIIEISGIKKYIINSVREISINGVDVIYTHPVAGSEKVGVYHSDKKIFKNANYVITPVNENKKSNLDLAERLAREMGFANISYVTPEAHDDIIAYTSQLTHVLSLSLVNSLSTDLETRKFIGDSYRDLTRISMINDKLWPQLFLNNKNALLDKIERFEKELAEFKVAIASDQSDKLGELMVKSTSIRSGIERGNNDES